MTNHEGLRSWVQDVARLTQPDRVQWCDGSEVEYKRLVALMVETGVLIPLNGQTHPGCYLHRSHPSDVARTENLTFICTQSKDDAGPTNNWMAPEEAHRKLDSLFDGSMKGRTMYVVPYVMGPLDSPYASAGVEITDSPYVAASMRIMTRMGTPALRHIESKGAFIRGMHSIGDLSPERRFIMHFPEERTIRSVGSGYGGNALLGKKCHALRIASWDAKREGWLAEHMLIMGVENPAGETRYIAAAFPSACGKTNLAMLNPPPAFKGYRIWTVGEDIAWMHLAADGRLWAVNPEAGMFGVAPGTGPKTNPNILSAIGHDTIYTNVAMTPERQPWWEGLTDTPPAGLADWQGRPYGAGNGPAAHPNARFTAANRQLRNFSPAAEFPEGVPISAILVGGRRASVVPLVAQALDWQHGVYMAASTGSETTAAATGQAGIVRRDPMAMLPFCGYNMADYWAHWLSFGRKSAKLPKVFTVNWFRRDASGKFMWPGYGENLRVLRWILDRCEGQGSAVRTPIGFLPGPGAIDLQGLDLSAEAIRELTSVDSAAWLDEVAAVEEFFARFGPRMAKGLLQEAARIRSELRQTA
ncbi:MAG: phosphoenolpyruvate carboxykinase (GTP) [SAR324 cluster bacterium]